MRTALAIVVLFALLCACSAKPRLPDLLRTYFVKVIEDGNSTYFSPSYVQMHIGDRLEFKWSGLTKPINIEQVSNENATVYSTGFRSGAVKTQGSFYWYPVFAGKYYWQSVVSTAFR